MSDSTPVSSPESQLVPIFASQIGGQPAQVCDGRTLHAFLENGDLFANWIKARIEKYGFQENQDFAIALENTKAKKGGQNRKDYHLCLDMAKELSMVENNAKGRELRRYFISCERRVLAAASTRPPLIPDFEKRAGTIPGPIHAAPLADFPESLRTVFKPQRIHPQPRQAPASFLDTLLGLRLPDPDGRSPGLRLLDLVETAADQWIHYENLGPDRARALLAEHGLLINPPWFILSHDHPRLAWVLRGTPWTSGWATTAGALPGAIAQGLTRFGTHRSRGTTVLLTTALAIGHGERVAPLADLPEASPEALAAAQAELLRLNPRWGTIARCASAGLTEEQTARALEVSATTVNREKSRMRTCGLLVGTGPVASLPLLGGAA